MFSITWNNSFTDSLNDLLTVLSAVENRNGQLYHGCRWPEDRPRAQVCIQACSKGQGSGHDEICVKIYIWDIRVKSWGNSGGIFEKKQLWIKKNSFNKRLCTLTCKAFIYAVLQEKRRFYHKPPFSGLDGSRTRVRNTIPCPSTSVVYYLTFPLPHDNKQPCGFSSFMIRPMAQSFANVVSHIVEAWVLKCECSRSDCCH